MQTAPSPQSNAPQVKPNAKRSGYWGLALTALLAGIFGVGVGTALRFQVVPAVTDHGLSPDQAFPPLADWPPQVPRENQPHQDADDTPSRRLLPAAEAATSRPANTTTNPEDAPRRSNRATPPATYTAPSRTPALSSAHTGNQGEIDSELEASLDNVASDNVASPDIESRFSEDITEPVTGTITETSPEPFTAPFTEPFTAPLESSQPRFDRETTSPVLEAPREPTFDSRPLPLAPAPLAPAPSQSSGTPNLGSTLRLPEKSRPALPLAPAPAVNTPLLPVIEEE